MVGVLREREFGVAIVEEPSSMPDISTSPASSNTEVPESDITINGCDNDQHNTQVIAALCE